MPYTNLIELMDTRLFNPLKYSVLGLLFGVLLIVSGCKKSPVSMNAEINQWVADSMRYYYYWNTAIPSNNNLNFELHPENFFETLLKRPDDRFSWIQNFEDLRNNLSGVIKTNGLAYSFHMYKNTVVLSVRYVHKGSPADEQGIKRGDLFVGINGGPWQVSDGSITNAQPLVGNETFSLVKGIEGANNVAAGESVSLTPVEDFQERAIHLDSVITTLNGTKVGYIFYNRFLNEQAGDLIDAFQRLKAENVTELIIDERYNGGGSIGVAALLSAFIHKDFDTGSPFIMYEFNSRFRDETLTYGDLLGDATAVVNSGNLGLDRVFILATERSASASELLINNLRPFLGASNVIHIGETTYGKDDASITISNSSSRFTGDNDWGIQPIVLKYKNRDGGGGFVNGLVPTHEVSEVVPLAPMGSSNDPLIAKALGIIDPGMQAFLDRQMSLSGANRLGFDQERLTAPAGHRLDPRPLDVTNTLGSNRKPLEIR